ncbi:hypothetical protein BH11PSE11_BH11PSE11_28440 [soil metagenome]
MNWYRNPEAVDQLASAYVLGTLHGGARRRFDALMQGHPLLAEAVVDWTRRLGPMLTTLPPMQPSSGLWKTIALRAGITPPSTRRSWWQRWFGPLLSPIPAGALAMGLVLGVMAPIAWQLHTESQRQTQLPESYVGVLGTAQGKPGLIVSSLRQGKIVEVKQITPVPVPEGSTLYLWRIDKAGVVTPIGPIPNGKFVRMGLAEPAEKVFFTAVELAVSIVPAGSTPDPATQVFVYRGLCGKLWKVAETPAK